MRLDTTEREDTPVVYAASPGEPDDIPGAAKRAWGRLEAVLTPKGRKAFGYWSPQDREYRACFSIFEADDPATLGLEETILPGGLYRRGRLKGEDANDLIGPTFDELARDADVDDTRPFIEFYRRHNEVDVLVPVRRA